MKKPNPIVTVNVTLKSLGISVEDEWASLDTNGYKARLDPATKFYRVPVLNNWTDLAYWIFVAVGANLSEGGEITFAGMMREMQLIMTHVDSLKACPPSERESRIILGLELP